MKSRIKLNKFSLLSLITITVLILLGLPDIYNSRSVIKGSSIGWNSNNNHLEVLECINAGVGNVIIDIDVKDNLDAKLSSHQLGIGANGTKHLILKEILPKNSYGKLLLRSSLPTANCAIITYRLNKDGGIEYATSSSTTSPIQGDSYGIFNSMRTSPNADLATAHWLTLINEEDSIFNASLSLQNGVSNQLQETIPIQLAPGERRDIELSIAGDKKEGVAIYKISPEEKAARYKSFLNRYSKDNEASFNFNLLFPSSSGYLDSGIIPVSTMEGSVNWAEIANISEIETVIVAEVASQVGELMKSEEFNLSPNSSKHIFLNDILGENTTGSFRVTSKSGKILVNSIVYGSMGEGAKWATSFASSKKMQKNKFIFPYNTNINSANWLKIFSAEIAKPLAVELSVFDSKGQGISLSDKANILVTGSKDIAIHEIVGDNQVGWVEVKSSESFRADFIRVFNKSSIFGSENSSSIDQSPSSIMAVSDIESNLSLGSLTTGTTSQVGVQSLLDGKASSNSAQDNTILKNSDQLFSVRKTARTLSVSSSDTSEYDTSNYITQCKGRGIDIPAMLPDIADNNPLNGWTFVGEYSGSHQDIAIPGQFLSVYTFSNVNTLCYYAVRFSKDISNNNRIHSRVGNGVLCYNKSTCEVCALDKNNPSSDFDPRFTTDLDHFNKPVEDGEFKPPACSTCHTQGPLFPEMASYSAITGPSETIALMNACAANCGPAWIGGSSSYDYPTNGCDKKNRILCPPQEGCKDCHEHGWVKPASELWAGHALDQTGDRGGSMRDFAIAYPESCWNAVECLGYDKDDLCPDRVVTINVSIGRINGGGGIVRNGPEGNFAIDCPDIVCSKTFGMRDMPILGASPSADSEFVGWEGPCEVVYNYENNVEPLYCRVKKPTEGGLTVEIKAVFKKKETYPAPKIIKPVNREVVNKCSYDAKWIPVRNANNLVAKQHIFWFAEIYTNAAGQVITVPNTITQTGVIDTSGINEPIEKQMSLSALKNNAKYRFSVASCGNSGFDGVYDRCEKPKWTTVDFRTSMSKPDKPIVVAPANPFTTEADSVEFKWRSKDQASHALTDRFEIWAAIINTRGVTSVLTSPNDRINDRYQPHPKSNLYTIPSTYQVNLSQLENGDQVLFSARACSDCGGCSVWSANTVVKVIGKRKLNVTVDTPKYGFAAVNPPFRAIDNAILRSGGTCINDRRNSSTTCQYTNDTNVNPADYLSTWITPRTEYVNGRNISHKVSSVTGCDNTGEITAQLQSSRQIPILCKLNYVTWSSRATKSIRAVFANGNDGVEPEANVVKIKAIEQFAGVVELFEVLNNGRIGTRVCSTYDSVRQQDLAHCQLACSPTAKFKAKAFARPSYTLRRWIRLSSNGGFTEYGPGEIDLKCGEVGEAYFDSPPPPPPPSPSPSSSNNASPTASSSSVPSPSVSVATSGSPSPTRTPETPARVSN